MLDYQRRFLEACLAQGVLRFGDFTLKSGRRSPYFFNMGNVCTGAALAQLGRAYARTLLEHELAWDGLFGPAYKGITLAAATSIALAETGHDVPWTYNRKEAKDHGEGGTLVGAPLAGRIVVVDDVITAGTASRQALQLLAEHGAEPAALLVALDRCEAGRETGLAASEEMRRDFDIPVLAIARFEDLLELAGERPDLAEHRSALAQWHDTCIEK